MAIERIDGWNPDRETGYGRNKKQAVRFRTACRFGPTVSSRRVRSCHWLPRWVREQSRWFPGLQRPWSRLAPPDSTAHRGSLLASCEFASIIEARLFQDPSGAMSVFEQAPWRKEIHGSRHFPFLEDIALSCRFSWFRPNSGHPSSFFGMKRYHLINSSIPLAQHALPCFGASLEIPEKNSAIYFDCEGALRARTLNQIGEPSKPNAARIWFSRKRSKEKCSLTSRSVKRTNVGGATAACVM